MCSTCSSDPVEAWILAGRSKATASEVMGRRSNQSNPPLDDACLCRGREVGSLRAILLDDRVYFYELAK